MEVVFKGDGLSRTRSTGMPIFIARLGFPGLPRLNRVPVVSSKCLASRLFRRREVGRWKKTGRLSPESNAAASPRMPARGRRLPEGLGFWSRDAQRPIRASNSPTSANGRGTAPNLLASTARESWRVCEVLLQCAWSSFRVSLRRPSSSVSSATTTTAMPVSMTSRGRKRTRCGVGCNFQPLVS